MPHLTRIVLLIVTLGSFPACAFHTTAEEWSGRVGASGRPVFYTSTSKVGLNLFVGIPILGDTAVDGMVQDLTEFVAERGGDRVRMVQGNSENYWYGFPPLTWIFTPVISSVDATWEPSPEDFARLREKWAQFDGEGVEGWSEEQPEDQPGVRPQQEPGEGNG